MTSELKIRFPRNYNIEKSYQKEYNELKRKGFFKDKDNTIIFIFSMIFGFNAKKSKSLKDPYPVVNCTGFDDESAWLIASIAIKEKGMEVLNDMNDIRKIAERYANGGFELLKDELDSEKSGDMAKRLEAKILDMIDK